MNIKVDRHLFLSELYYLQGMVGGKQLIPILSHLYIDARPGKILMRATDLNITITTECEAKVRDVGAVCLPARKLMEIVKSLPQGEIEIQADSSCHATITCQRSRFKLLGTKGEHFPELRQFSGEFSEVPAEIFARFIPRVIHAVGQEYGKNSQWASTRSISTTSSMLSTKTKSCLSLRMTSHLRSLLPAQLIRIDPY
jgi:DNA polymerase-3 subunit beta